MAVTGHIKHMVKDGGVPGLIGRTLPGGVKVGILKGIGEHPNATGGQTTAEIAFWNEFGTRNDDGSIHTPERPFMRTTMKTNGPTYRKLEQDLLKSMLLNRLSVKKAEARIGLQVQRDLKAAIVAWADPPNAPSTIAAKGANNPLEDIGAMRNAIHWVGAKRGLL